MVNYREILRLSALKHVQRDICSAMHCSDHTVRAVLKEAAKHNIHWPLDEDITNTELERILFPDKYQKISTYVEPDYPYIHRELAKPGVNDIYFIIEEPCLGYFTEIVSQARFLPSATISNVAVAFP